jgi:glycosyltransferase involved in cell wall biosynthesis
MSRRELVTVCFGGFPGTNRHLREIRRVTGLTRHLVVSGSTPASADVAFLRDHLVTLAPRCVIFGGWHAVYEPLIDAARAAGAEVAVLWTSSVAQTDLSGETAALASLLRDRRVTRFFAASEALVGPLGATERPSHVLPLPFSIAATPRVAAKPEGTTPVVSLFAAPNEFRRKNALACVLALAGLDVPYVLRLNGLAERAEYRTFLEELKVPYDDRGWLDDDDYARALDEVDVGVQPSLAESFNYVVAEHFARAVPVVVSRSVPVAHGLPEHVDRLLVVADPDDPGEIRGKLRVLLTEPEARREAGCAVREHIERVSARNAEAARRTLTAVLAER